MQKAVIAQAEGDLPRAAALLAPLHAGADDSSALETQVYQAILERNSAPIIPRLKEVLANPALLRLDPMFIRYGTIRASRNSSPRPRQTMRSNDAHELGNRRKVRCNYPPTAW